MATVTVLANVFAGIAFDPTIRGILAVGVGVVVLMGSVYLLLATNTGNRLGFLLAMTGFFGWMAIMGLIWWIYGIGMQGQSPTWKVVEYNAGDTAQAITDPLRDLDTSVLPTEEERVDFEEINRILEEEPQRFEELDDRLEDASDGWKFLRAADPTRGEAEAVVSDQLPDCDTCNFGIEEAGDYVVLTAFEVGGKEGLPDDPNMFDRVATKLKQTATITHPKHYAVIQVQKAVEVEAVPGEAPPIPEPDPEQPVISVVMIRDIGDVRFPAAMITIGSLLIFGLLCWVLHQRERILEANLAAAEAAGSARRS